MKRIDIHICPVSGCSSCLVYPVAWREVQDDCWEIELRCPSCEWSERGIYRHEDVERFDDVLNRGTDRLITDLEDLSKANFEDYARRFVDALRGGHLLPSDF